MNHYENKIEPIGESMEIKNLKIDQLGKLHEYIINKNTYIDMLKKEIKNLDELISGYKTFSENEFMIKNLNDISQRIKIDLAQLEKSCDGIVDYIEANINN